MVRTRAVIQQHLLPLQLPLEIGLLQSFELLLLLWSQRRNRRAAAGTVPPLWWPIAPAVMVGASPLPLLAPPVPIPFPIPVPPIPARW